MEYVHVFRTDAEYQRYVQLAVLWKKALHQAYDRCVFNLRDNHASDNSQ